MKPPLQRLRDRMGELDLPVALITHATNVGWLTGFTGSTAMVLVTADDGVFISDSRYREQASEQVTGLRVEILQAPRTYPEVLAEQAALLGVTGVGFEADHVTYGQLAGWKKKADALQFTPVEKLIEPLRQIKYNWEYDLIRRACGITDACFEHVRRLFQLGVTELDIAIEIEFFIRRQGAMVAFDVIAVSGARSARPHGVPSDKRLEPGDFLTLDFGARVEGYNSDMTRTVVIGEPTPRHRLVYDAVLSAQLAAIEMMKPGVAGKDVDAEARRVLATYDLAQYFGHGLGHGLGRDVHDPGSLSASSTDVLETGMILTVEPGVYIEGFGGVRIEDDVAITTAGAEILNNTPKELAAFG